jgi:hypothetical protein
MPFCEYFVVVFKSGRKGTIIDFKSPNFFYIFLHFSLGVQKVLFLLAMAALLHALTWGFMLPNKIQNTLSKTLYTFCKGEIKPLRYVSTPKRFYG